MSVLEQKNKKFKSKKDFTAFFTQISIEENSINDHLNLVKLETIRDLFIFYFENDKFITKDESLNIFLTPNEKYTSSFKLIPNLRIDNTPEQRDSKFNSLNELADIINNKISNSSTLYKLLVEGVFENQGNNIERKNFKKYINNLFNNYIKNNHPDYIRYKEKQTLNKLSDEKPNNNKPSKIL